MTCNKQSLSAESYVDSGQDECYVSKERIGKVRKRRGNEKLCMAIIIRDEIYLGDITSC